jgi:hypothetical protein
VVRVSDATLNGTTKPKRQRERGRTWSEAVESLRSESVRLDQPGKDYTAREKGLALHRAFMFLNEQNPPKRRRKP